MAVFERSCRTERDLKWAKIWFSQFAAFHGRHRQSDWRFTKDDVIAYSRSKLKMGAPAWKRLRMVQGLMSYRRRVQDRPVDDLKPIHKKLQEIVARERTTEAGALSIDEVVGKINPREPDVIQDYRRALRLLGKKYATERAYVSKLKAFMNDRGLRCRADFDPITGADVEAHLTDLAVDGNVAPSTQNQAFHALLFLFEHVLKRDIGKIEAIRAAKGKQIPTVMSCDEVERVFNELNGVPSVIAKLLYGCGMRISEVLRLRIKDIDFDNALIEIHQSKGGKSRLVPLPNELVEPLRRMVKSRRVLHEQDLEDGTASVWLPHSLARKYPSAAREFRWQFLFASARHSRDPRSGAMHRHHIHRDTFPSHLRHAVERAGITKHVSSHTFRHSFATHLLRQGSDIRTIQELLGHRDVKTTMIYTHVVNRDDVRVVSPLDRLSPNRQEDSEQIDAPVHTSPQRIPGAELEPVQASAPVREPEPVSGPETAGAPEPKQREIVAVANREPATGPLPRLSAHDGRKMHRSRGYASADGDWGWCYGVEKRPSAVRANGFHARGTPRQVSGPVSDRQAG